MRVKCVTEEVPDNVNAAVSLGPAVEGRRTFGVHRGRTYVVYGLEIHRGIPWISIEVERNEIVSVPLLLFEIVDPTIPDVWEARVTDHGDLVLWPAAFFTPDFFQKAYEGDPVAMAALERAREQLTS